MVTNKHRKITAKANLNLIYKQISPLSIRFKWYIKYVSNKRIKNTPKFIPNGLFSHGRMLYHSEDQSSRSINLNMQDNTCEEN